MTDVLVRPATPSDALGIAAIYDAAVLHSVATFEDTPPGPERWRSGLARHTDSPASGPSMSPKAPAAAASAVPCMPQSRHSAEPTAFV
jgi:hypothetical protein